MTIETLYKFSKYDTDLEITANEYGIIDFVLRDSIKWRKWKSITLNSDEILDMIKFLESHLTKQSEV